MGSKGLLISAGAGALITVAGLCVAKKLKQYFTSRHKMRTIRQNLLLSPRCAWLLAELGVEENGVVIDDDRVTYLPEPIHLPPKHRGKLVRQEADYQVVVYSPCVSCEDLTVDSYHGNSSSCGYDTTAGGLLDDDFTMIESAALCLYLADLYGQLVAEPRHRAEYYSWILYSSATFDSLVKTIHSELLKCSAARDEALLESALQGFHAFARALSDTLLVNDYLCGTTFSAADCVLGFTLFCANTIDHGRLLRPYPAISSYLCRLHSRNAFQQTFCGDIECRLDMSHYFASFTPRICASNNNN